MLAVSVTEPDAVVRQSSFCINKGQRNVKIREHTELKPKWVGVEAFSDLGYSVTGLEKSGLLRCHGNGLAAGGRDFLHRDPDEERSAFLFLAEPVL